MSSPLKAKAPYASGILLLLILLIPSLSLALTAVDVSSQSTRSLGTSGAYTAIVDDYSAFNLNPAGLSRNAEMRKVYLNSRFYEDFKHWGLNAALIDGKTEDPLHWGFLFDTTRTTAIKKEQYALASSFSWQNMILAGTTTRFVQFNRTALIAPLWVFTMDAGLLALISDYVSLGASAKNLVRSKSQTQLAPVIFTGGLGLNFKSTRIDFDAERNQSENRWIGRVGIEYLLTPFMTLRGGYFQNSKKTEWGYSVGGSFQPDTRFNLDVGFLDPLQSSYKVFSMGFSVTI